MQDKVDIHLARLEAAAKALWLRVDGERRRRVDTMDMVLVFPGDDWKTRNRSVASRFQETPTLPSHFLFYVIFKEKN